MTPYRHLSPVVAALGFAASSCSSSSSSDRDASSGGSPAASGGAAATGGSVTGGVSSSSGGAQATGGQPATGGYRGSGGSARGSGGASATGGLGDSGGDGVSGGTASGGAAGSGGLDSTGGTPTGGTASGGMPSGGRSFGGFSGRASGGSETGGSGGSGVGGATGGTSGSGGSGVGGATGSGGGTGTVATTVTIKPGGTWNDTTGTPIQAHGGGFLKVGDTWYWVGEDKTTNTGGSGFFYAVSIYASKDLVTWEHRNKIITTATDSQLASNRIIERPKIIYNEKTKMYVVWAHWDDTSYNSSCAGIFKSPTIDGNYTYVDHIKPGGHDSRDSTLFREDDGTAYFISVSNNNSDLWVYPLSDDYLSVKSGSTGTNIFPGQYREAPAIVKINGTYYAITSWSSGWNPNQGQYSTASSITGPWSAQKNIGDDTTYQSQSTYIITVAGSQSTTYIFAGDRWNSGNLSKSQYVWLPLTISGTTMSMSNYTQWSLNLGTGVWSAN
jgi:hypothetical protein